MPRRYWVVLWVVLVVVGLDQGSKDWATTHLHSPQAACLMERQVCWGFCQQKEQKSACERSCVEAGDKCFDRARLSLDVWKKQVEALKKSLWCRDVLIVADIASPACVVIPGLLNFRYALNPGSAWGVFGGLPVLVRRGLFVLITLLAFVFLTTMLRRARDEETLLILGIAGIASGAVGNFTDRLRVNHVIDFIDIYWTTAQGTSHWPTFNIADIAISFGVFFFALHTLFGGAVQPAQEPLKAP